MAPGVVCAHGEVLMKKVLMGLAVLPFLTGVAAAGQPLTNQQMDRVTAGFFSVVIVDAQGLVGESGIVTTTTAALSQVIQAARATAGETSSVLMKSIAAGQASTNTSTFTPIPISTSGG